LASAGIGAAILFGAAMLFGDGLITPAISVLSAVEGLKMVTLGLEKFVVPLTIIILVALFLLQKKGSGRVDSWFGPIMIIWFLALIFLGLPQIINHPIVLQALNPLFALKFIGHFG